MNKRFLGLGFTFTAQDKGLEKKLTKIAELMERINKASGSGSVGSASGGATMRSAGAEARASHEKSPKIQTAKLASENMEYLRGVVKKYVDVLGKDTGEDFRKSSEQLLIEAKRRRRTSDSVLLNLIENAEKFSKSADNLGPKFDALRRVFVYIKSWVGEISKSVENFLDVLGLRIRDLIPKEFLAALGVVKSTLAPVGAMFKNVFSSMMKSSTEKFRAGISAGVERVTKDISPDTEEVMGTLGSSKSIPTIQKMLYWMLNKQDEDKKKPGIFDKFKNLPLIGGLITAGVAIWSFIKKMKFITTVANWFSKLGSVFEGFRITELFATLGRALRLVAKPFQLMGELFIEVIAPLTALAATFIGFSKEMWNQKDKIIEWFNSVGTLFSSIAKYLMTYIKVKFAPVIEIIDSFIVQPMKVVGEVLWGIVKLFWNVFEMFGKNIAKLVGGVFDISSFLNRETASFIDKQTAELKKEGSVPTRKMQDAINGKNEHIKDQIDVTSKLSDKIGRLSDNFETLLQTGALSKQSVDINIKTKPKEIEYQMRQNEIAQQLRAGSG